jgi:hypothetical protein
VPRRPYAQFLELLFQDEIYVRHQHLINRRQKLADFRELRSLDNFDFSFNANISRAQIYELAHPHRVLWRGVLQMPQRLDAISERWWRRDSRLRYTASVDSRNKLELRTWYLRTFQARGGPVLLLA